MNTTSFLDSPTCKTGTTEKHNRNNLKRYGTNITACDVESINCSTNSASEGNQKGQAEHTGSISCDKTIQIEQVNDDFGSCESETENSGEEILEITLSDYGSDVQDMDISNRNQPQILSPEHSYCHRQTKGDVATKTTAFSIACLQSDVRNCEQDLIQSLHSCDADKQHTHVSTCLVNRMEVDSKNSKTNQQLKYDVEQHEISACDQEGSEVFGKEHEIAAYDQEGCNIPGEHNEMAVCDQEVGKAHVDHQEITEINEITACDQEGSEIPGEKQAITASDKECQEVSGEKQEITTSDYECHEVPREKQEITTSDKECCEVPGENQEITTSDKECHEVPREKQEITTSDKECCEVPGENQEITTSDKECHEVPREKQEITTSDKECHEVPGEKQEITTSDKECHEVPGEKQEITTSDKECHEVPGEKQEITTSDKESSIPNEHSHILSFASRKETNDESCSSSVEHGISIEMENTSTCERNTPSTVASNSLQKRRSTESQENVGKTKYLTSEINNTAMLFSASQKINEGNYDLASVENRASVMVPTIFQNCPGTHCSKTEQDCVVNHGSAIGYSSAATKTEYSLAKHSTQDCSSHRQTIGNIENTPGGADSKIEQASRSPEKLPELLSFCPKTLKFTEPISTCELDMECDAENDTHNPLSMEQVAVLSEQSHVDSKSKGLTHSQCFDSYTSVNYSHHRDSFPVSSISLNMLEDMTHKLCPQHMVHKPSSCNTETFADFSKNIKREPVDFSCEQPVFPVPDTNSKNTSLTATNLPPLEVCGNIKYEVPSPTHSIRVKVQVGTNDSSHQKCTIKNTPCRAKKSSYKEIKTKLPVVSSKESETTFPIPFAIFNNGYRGHGQPCSYIIPINSLLASSPRFQTVVQSTDQTPFKNISLMQGGKVVKKVQQKDEIATSLQQNCSIPDTLTLKFPVGHKEAVDDFVKESIDVTQNRGDFKIKSLDIAGISGLVQRKNLEKIYKAPVPPLKLKSGKKTYFCTECGDTFLLEVSLKDHFSRCSMVIQYQCIACKVKLLFTNKCSLLKHLRYHSRGLNQPTSAALQIKADNISVLSVFEGNMPKTEKQFTVQNNRHCILHQHKKVNVETKGQNPCPECGQETHLKISHHFGSLGVICNFKHMCKCCSMYLPTACSLSAHLRLHKSINPFVCPECGKTFTILSSFKTHIETNCYHFNRVPVFICPICNIFVSNATCLKKHFVLKHQQTFYREQNGHEVFTTYEQYLKHRDKIYPHHTGDPEISFYCQICKRNMLIKLLINHMYSHLTTIKQNVPFGYICIACRDKNNVSRIFFVKSDLIKHLELHKQGKNFPCSECSMMFLTLAELENHVTGTHTCIDNVCQHCNISVDKMTFHLKHCESKNIAACFQNTSSPDCSKMKTLSCSDEFLSVLDTLNKTVCVSKESGSKANHNGFVCKYCGEEGCKTIKDFERHTSMHVKEGVLICNKCQRRNFKSFSGMKSHQILCGLDLNCSDNVKFNNKDVHCKDCNKYFKDHAMLKKHVKEEHAFYPCHLCGLTYRADNDLDVHMNTVHRGKKTISLSCRLCKGKKGRGKTFMRKEFYYNHMARVHGINQLTDEVNTSKRKSESTESGCPLKRLKVSDNDQYSCAKCEFSTADSDEFSSHIAKHKKEDSIQCPNCGLCFSVVPALRRHLLLVHKIQNADQFIVKRGLQMTEEDDEVDLRFSSLQGPKSYTYEATKCISPDQISDNPMECFVCNRLFETQAKKKFHMRTHGMAFISSKHRQLSTKSTGSDDVELIDVLNCDETNTQISPEKITVDDTSKFSPISVTKPVKLSDKNKILQASNQPVVNVERMDTDGSVLYSQLCVNPSSNVI